LSSDDEPLWIAAKEDYAVKDSKVGYFNRREFQVTLAKYLLGKTST
jgi:hypothetical protein